MPRSSFRWIVLRYCRARCSRCERRFWTPISTFGPSCPKYRAKPKQLHGHPILIGREMIEQFLRAPATAVARDIEHQHQQHMLYVPVADERVAANIDTPEQYERLLRAETIPAETTF